MTTRARRRSPFTAPLAAALALLAGHAAALPAAAPPPAPGAPPGGGGESTLMLGRLVVRRTSAAITDPRLSAYAGSPVLMITWNEVSGRGDEGWYAVSFDGGGSIAQSGPVPTPAPAEPVALTVVPAEGARGETAVILGRTTLRQTGAKVQNARLFTFEGSLTLMAAWDEVGAEGTAEWFAISLDAGATVAQVVEARPLLRLRYGTFDPRAAAPAPPAVARDLAEPEGNELFLVQFVGTPLEEMRAEVRGAGGVIHRFLTENTHLVRMSPDTRAAVERLPYVRWVGPYQQAYRLDEEVRAAVESRPPSAPMEEARYSVEVMEDGPGQQQAIADLIRAGGGTVHFLVHDQHRLEATMGRELLLKVLARNEVSFIDPTGPMEPDMNIIRQYGGAVPLLSTAGFLGQGVRGEAFDTQVNMNHEKWGGVQPLLHGPVITAGTHGTSVYGINFATFAGTSANANNAVGLLPLNERGIFYHYRACSQGTFGGTQTRMAANIEATDPAGPYRSSYQTSSIGSLQVTTYTTVSQEVDDYLFKVDYLSFQSQSNTSQRTSRPQAWAKNIVSVGGLELAETTARTDDSKASGASFGPAQDMRVKPDLAHAYSGIWSPTDSLPTSYTNFGGTSGATPITAGHGGLVSQMWHQGVWSPYGGADTVFLSRPKSTTAKALMINGAFRYSTASGYGNINITYRRFVGWGMADLTKLYNERARTYVIDCGDALVNGQTRTYTFAVAPGMPELRATMVYPDPAPATTAGQNRVNDLSMRVTSPSGAVYWGNNGMVPLTATDNNNVNYSVAGGAANTYDTVENVFIQNPLAGTWTVEVIASQVVQDGNLATPGVVDAVYSLVVANVTPATPPGACYANCDGSSAPPVLALADFTCFMFRYLTGDSYANCDGSTQPPVLNVADFGCFLQQYAAGCP